MGIFQQVSVTPTFYAQFLHQYFCTKKIIKTKRNLRKAAGNTFVQKNVHVDEIDNRWENIFRFLKYSFYNPSLILSYLTNINGYPTKCSILLLKTTISSQMSFSKVTYDS
jgi:hypothetical protein